jgi:DNA helicase II / ATP-dependent DNA helicase PcrA
VFPGPPELGRGAVIEPGGEAPGEWPRVLASSGDVDSLHAHWLERRPVVVVLDVDSGELRAPEVFDGPVWSLAPSFEFRRERLQYLVWRNNYDCRKGEPVWWHGRRAVQMGASAGSETDVVLPDGTAAWCDGGPRQRLPLPVVHRESLDAGSLTLDRWSAPGAALAEDQLAAVTHDAGPARIIAPAGSGKTRVLTERLRHVLADRGFVRSTVTAVAYNKRAADEMVERTAGLGAQIRTLNSLGLAIVNSAGARPKTMLEEFEVRRILEGLVEVPRRQNTDPWAVYIDALSAVRLGLTDPRLVEEALPDAAGVAEAFDVYRGILADRGAVDFDEQIYLAIELLLRDPDLRRRWQGLCRHLLVDEFQDLTPAHLLLLRLLAAPTYDVFGVGDDDQVIYSYAGASPEFLIGYEQYFPGAEAHALTVNYRCPPAVVDGARHLLSYNDRRIAKEISAAPGRSGDGEDLSVVRVPEARQAPAVLERVREWADGGAGWASMAVLTRVNSALLPVQVTLMEEGVPCMAPLGKAILARTGIRAALAYLRIGVDPGAIQRADMAETIRRPSRRIARNVAELLQKRPTTSVREMRRLAEALSGNDVEKVHHYADDLQLVADAVRASDTAGALRVIRERVGLGSAMDVLDSSRGEADRSTHADDLLALEQVAALHPDAATFEGWLADVLARPGALDGVVLSTVHRVKGREWPRVVVFGANEGLFPHRLATSVEEERRVFHVAVTRASEQTVVLASAEGPSPFCEELSGTAPRRPLRVGREPTPARERKPAAAGPVLLPSRAAAVGMRVEVSGGMEAVVMGLTDTGVVVAPGGGKARVALPWGSEVRVEGAVVRLARPGAPSPDDAFAALKAWRSEVAAREKVPAYVVFSDDHLTGIASALPATLEEFARCKGVGPAKLERYGDEVLAVLEQAGTPP